MPGDLEAILRLWLAANLQAHSFIDAHYWQGQYDTVRQLLPLADIMVYAKEGEICGFVGMTENHIEGIFVAPQHQSRGIGKRLLDACKQNKSTLSLAVYQKNKGAVAFYQREGFSVIAKQIDENTGETELLMQWALT